MKARGHKDDDSQADGSQRSQPRQDARCHRQYQTSSAEYLRDADRDHQRTSEVGESDPFFQAASDDLRRAGCEKEKCKKSLHTPQNDIQHINLLIS